MGDILLNKNTLKRVCDKMRVNILERRSKEREKRKREREKEDKVKGINAEQPINYTLTFRYAFDAINSVI